MCIYNFVSCKYLFVVCAFCYFCCSVLWCCPLLPLTSSLLSEGRRRRWGGGGGCGGDVPPCQRVRLGALHPRAALPPPAYRGTSKPQKMHTESQRQEQEGSPSWLSCKSCNGHNYSIYTSTVLVSFSLKIIFTNKTPLIPNSCHFARFKQNQHKCSHECMQNG